MDKALEQVRGALSAEEWTRRVAEAERQAAVLERVLERVGRGESQAAAMAAEAPGEHRTTWVARLGRFRRGGRDGLIARNVPVQPDRLITPETVTLARGMAVALGEQASSTTLLPALEKATGESWSDASVRRVMTAAGVSRPVGRPVGRGAQAQAHPLAGAELLLAVDEELGATAALAKALAVALEELPAAEGEVRDDRAGRDDHGRFEGAYNEAPARTHEELGGKFDSVEVRRKGKDLRAMRVAQTSVEALRRKVQALMLLPVVTDSPRWEALRHWQGDHLEALVGVAYKPATLDKFARELKYADVVEAAQLGVAGFWMRQPETGQGPLEGVALVFADTTTKPVWTDAFTKCVRVSKRGRVMPGVSTVYLHTGPGTPVLYQSFSGHASLPAEVTKLLRSYEDIAGEETVRRLLVIDKEGHSVEFFKELTAAGWQFIVPLRKSVTTNDAAFSDRTEWVPYQDAGDEVRGGKLLLRDAKDPNNPLLVRVVERRRHRTNKIEHYATTADPEDLPDAVALETYFARWPLEEHRFKDGNGRVHLDAQHGYGKLEVDNVAVIDRHDKLLGHIRRLEAVAARHEERANEAREELEMWRDAIATAKPQIDADRRKLDEAMTRGEPMTARLQQLYQSVRDRASWLDKARHNEALEVQRLAEDEQGRATALETRARKQVEVERLSAQRQIFTVDVVLDQILTAFKLTFMNLAAALMTRCLPGPRLQLDTLIRGILTLPGERVRTKTRETLRIYKHDRDPALMARVGQACQALTARGIVRDNRTLVFELVEAPGRARSGRRASADAV